tara:strand:+ start:21132 stop:21416 length:285 start_codon:yes stop_codon:yes gene_type:complete
MVRVLLLNSDEKLVAEALAEYGSRNVYVAENGSRQDVKRLGLDRYAFVGADADRELYEIVLPTNPSPTKKRKGKKALDKEVEAVADESTDEVLS